MNLAERTESLTLNYSRDGLRDLARVAGVPISPLKEELARRLAVKGFTWDEPDEITYGALFAGYGGLELGIQSVLGGRMKWYAEFDKSPSKIMAFHHDEPNLGDVTKIDWHKVPRVRVIAGGSPCQDLSHAGKRKGMKAGTRSGLWASMCDAVEIIRPDLVVWENVRGALNAEADSAVEPCPLCVGDEPAATLRALGRVLGDLAELGYDGWWCGLRAADVGAAHGRFRIFVFATPRDAGGEGREGRRSLGGGLGRGREAREGRGAGHPAGRGILSLLPTPLASDAEHSGPNQRDSSGRPGLHGAVALLPTPVVNDMGEGKTPEDWDEWNNGPTMAHQKHGASLAIEAAKTATALLPTPKATNNENRCSPEYGPNLGTAVGVQPEGRLLPTPLTSDSGEGPADPMHRPKHGWGMQLNDSVRLLPTPITSDGNAPGEHGQGPDDLRTTVSKLVTEEIASEDEDGGFGWLKDALFDVPEPENVGPLGDQLLPTPCAQTGGQGGGAHDREKVAAFLSDDEAKWGAFAPAIRQHAAVLGREAPPPTEESGGKARLSPRFVEWMMMLPEGHVTDPRIGISRVEQLKALGNGVVPYQAAAACRLWIEDMHRYRDFIEAQYAG